jgi:hypothetical protein
MTTVTSSSEMAQMTVREMTEEYVSRSLQQPKYVSSSVHFTQPLLVPVTPGQSAAVS